MTLLFGALVAPLVILNMISGVVGGVWLAMLGEWRIIGIGLLSSFISPIVLGLILMMGGLIVGLPGAMLIEKGRPAFAFPFVLMSQLYVSIIAGLWCLFAFVFFSKDENPSNYWPLMLWSYSTTVAPWSYMAQREARAGGGNLEAVTVIFAQLSCIAFMFVGLILKMATIGILLFIALIIVGALFNTYFTYVLAKAIRENSAQKMSASRAL